MPSLRFQFRLRTLLIVIGIVAIALGLWRRSELLRREAAFHEKEYRRYIGERFNFTRFHIRVDGPIAPFAVHLGKLADYHGQLQEKYENAARYPWLPVPADPPPPTED